MKYDSQKRWVTIERKNENGRYSKELKWTTDCLLRNRKAQDGNKLRVTDTTFEFSADLLDVLIQYTCEHDDKSFDKRFYIVYLLLFLMKRDNLLQILDEDIEFFEELKNTYDLFVEDPSLQFCLPPVEFDPTKLEESFGRIVTDLIMNILSPYLDRGKDLHRLVEQTTQLEMAASKSTNKKQEKDTQHAYSSENLERMRTLGPAIYKWLVLYGNQDVSASKQINYKKDSQSYRSENANHCGFWAVAAQCARVLCMAVCSESTRDDKQASAADEHQPLVRATK